MKKVLKWVLLPLLAILVTLVINLFAFNIRASKISEGPPANPAISTGTALLIIDIQEATTGTVSVNESYIAQSDTLITKLNHLASKAAKKDWLVVYVKSEVVNPLINILNNCMARGSEGAKLDRRLELHSNHIITKRKNDSFLDTGLDELLRENKIGKLYVTGLDAAGCVNSTIQAALNREYKLSVITDAVISDPDSVRIQMFGEFEAEGIELVTMNSLWEK